MWKIPSRRTCLSMMNDYFALLLAGKPLDPTLEYRVDALFFPGRIGYSEKLVASVRTACSIHVGGRSNPHALFCTGLLKLKRWDDAASTTEYFLRTAYKCASSASVLCGYYLSQCAGVSPKNRERLLREGASRGHAASQRALALRLGVSSDEGKALLQTAAESGDPHAMRLLGMSLPLEKGARYLRRAAILGDDAAFRHLMKLNPELAAPYGFWEPNGGIHFWLPPRIKRCIWATLLVHHRSPLWAIVGRDALYIICAFVATRSGWS